jgi:hypothetical protein
MTFDKRFHAVGRKGFTERQARFLTTVMLHAGVCVPRQYARFCGIVYGAKTRQFFAKLVRLRYASMYDCRHNRARIRARDGFSEPRFKVLYRVWKEDREAAFAACDYHALDDAVVAGAGRVETLELGHRYGHLSSVVAVA